jgi:lipocalin-like protein
MKLLIVFSTILFLSACNNKQLADTNSKLAGMYKLLIIENMDSSGVWHEQQWGKGGDGYIVYDGKGHMAVEITPKSYKDFPWLSEEASINEDSVRQKVNTMSMDDLKAAVTEFSSNYVYVGNYTIDENAGVVQHDRISGTIPSVWDTKVKRRFTFKGDTIILEPLNANRRLKWIRQQ